MENNEQVVESSAPVPSSEEEVDSLLSSINEPAREELTAPGAKAKSPLVTEEQQAAKTAQEFEIKHQGKVLKAPIDKILKWAEMGYDAPNKIGELNKELQSWQQKEAALKGLDQKYSAVDNYVRENPEWWNHVQAQFEQKQAIANGDPAYQAIDSLKKEINDLKTYKEEAEQRRQEYLAKEEDKAYMGEIKSLQEAYPQVDFNTPDQSGKNLEYKVLEHAQANGIKNIKTAFRDFYHDEIIKLKQEEAKEKFIYDKQSRSKLGILGISPTPTKRMSDDVKGKSYNDLEREILSELGIRQ